MTPQRRTIRVVGAYAAQPDDARERRRYLDAVLSLPGVDGLEISWRAPGWTRDAPILADALGRHAGAGQHVLTLIGAAAAAAGEDGTVGLASVDEAGRARAVALAGAARQAVVEFLDRGQRIAAVALHAFPSRPQADAAAGGRALQRSLAEILAWDWGGAAIVVEHCDARPGAGPWQKGLLPLDVEIAAVAAVAAGARAPVGIALNWGRSAIEERDAGAPERHARRARAAGVLRGLMISGATDRAGAYGPAWSDTHPPLREQLAESVMDTACVRAASDAAGGGLLYDGVKVAARPPHDSVKDRVALIRGALAALPPP